MNEKIVAMVAIAILGIVSIFYVQNGYLLAACISAIAGLAGFTPPKIGKP